MDALGLALVALAYAVASEILGLSKAIPAASVIGLVLGGLAAARKRISSALMPAPAEPHNESASGGHRWGSCNYQELIELGYARRHALLSSPGVEDVEVSVMGEQLVLTVYRCGKPKGVGEHADIDPCEAALPTDSYCAMGLDGCG